MWLILTSDYAKKFLKLCDTQLLLNPFVFAITPTLLLFNQQISRAQLKISNTLVGIGFSVISTLTFPAKFNLMLNQKIWTLAFQWT